MSFSIKLTNYTYLQAQGANYWKVHVPSGGHESSLLPFGSSWIDTYANEDIYDAYISIWNTNVSTTVPILQTGILGTLLNGHDYQYDIVNYLLTDLTAWAGSIVSRGILCGETLYNFGDSIPLGTNGGPRVVIKNNSTTSTKLKLSYVMFYPDGSIALDDYIESGVVPVGAEVAGQFWNAPFGVEGTWLIALALAVWNGSGWIGVTNWPASGYGVLCMVSGGGTPEFSNLAVTYSVVP